VLEIKLDIARLASVCAMGAGASRTGELGADGLQARAGSGDAVERASMCRGVRSVLVGVVAGISPAVGRDCGLCERAHRAGTTQRMARPWRGSRVVEESPTTAIISAIPYLY
jgi:hypothetical protein